ncbi:peptidase domain-containing ABC transporter [Actinomadura rugatobispora]|uniref:Peptidase domain-containing ABC transporter n=1 Tax=Actinomadura rugatobispora TaxID=1994 RepID=A0ABW0ZYT8_9ACTN|nr:NHLP family bacteriocin export ABC transporter peptidase/permease/ATPase subunit [Actinomadura rugatobispora]
MPGQSSFDFFAHPRERGDGSGGPTEPAPGNGRTPRPPRFREEARQAASVDRELGPPMEKGGLPRPSWPADVRSLRIPARRRRAIPVHLQSQLSDCGPVSLMMALGHHGIEVGLEQLRQDTDCGRDGVSARALLTAARRHGLPGRGVRTSLEGLRSLPPGSILFWKFNHFVVLDRATRQYVYIVDPAYGQRRLRIADVDRLFTGVAVEFDAPLRTVRRQRRARRARRARSPWRHLAYFFPRSKKWLALVVASLSLLVFGLLTPLASAYAVDHRGLGGELTPVRAVAAVALSALCFFLLQLLRGTVILELQAAAEKRVTLGIFNRLLALPLGFFTRRAPGDLALRVRTSTSVRNVLTASMLSAAFDGVLVGCYLAAFFLVEPRIAVWVSLLAVIQVGLLLLAWRSQVYLAADELECQAHSNSTLNELLEGIGTVKAAGLDEVMGGKWTHSLIEEINAGTRRRRHFTLFSSLVASVQFTAPLLVLIIGALQVSGGRLGLGQMTAFTSLSMGIFIPLTGLVQAGFQVATLKAPLTRLGDILDAELDETGRTAESGFDTRGDLAVKGAWFQYPGAAAPVLRDIDLTVPAGRFVVFLGASGCGKSTLAMMLAGLYRPNAGRVLIGGKPFDHIDRASLRRSISFVDQDARIFAGSIRDNITMGAAIEDGSTCDYVHAAGIAQIHDEIAALPMGYETLLGSGGTGLSGGQRQRIALARALVRRPRILILDEATSALDRVTEANVISSIRRLDCTLLVITHRPATAAEADEICVFGEGRIVQRGDHGRLSRQPGPYRDLMAASGLASGPGASGTGAEARPSPPGRDDQGHLRNERLQADRAN